MNLQLLLLHKLSSNPLSVTMEINPTTTAENQNTDVPLRLYSIITLLTVTKET